MSILAVNDKYMALAKELNVDVYNYNSHKIITIPMSSKQVEQDNITDIALSADSRYLALVTSSMKQLVIYELPQLEIKKSALVPRSPSRIRFTVDTEHILVADKSGDVLIYDILKDTTTKLLGHLSLLLDVLQTNDARFIISSDRDEKIKVSHYPDTYNIQTYCLGHKEFVNHIEILPHNDKYLISTSGDGTVKVWEYTEGRLCLTINTYIDIKDTQLTENFIKIMDEGAIEVNGLPIVHCAITKFDNTSSLLAVTIYTYNAVLVYCIDTINDSPSHKLQNKVELERFPATVQFLNDRVFIYNDFEYHISVYKLLLTNGIYSCELHGKIKVFENVDFQLKPKESQFESIKILYKRKFDNVQEYQERKKQRLEKSLK